MPGLLAVVDSNCIKNAPCLQLVHTKCTSVDHICCKAAFMCIQRFHFYRHNNNWFCIDLDGNFCYFEGILIVQFLWKKLPISSCYHSDAHQPMFVIFVRWFRSLKMICNDFLVVKVNFWSYAFNIMKYVWILRNVKNKNIVEKNVWKCAPMIRKWWRHTRKTQPNHEPNSLFSVEC